MNGQRQPMEPAQVDLPLEPSTFVRMFGARLAGVANDSPILDVACGSGRNALALAQLGCTVICLDKDIARIKALRRRLLKNFPSTAARLIPQKIDLLEDSWPFGPSCVGSILNIHFFRKQLLQQFGNSIAVGQYLLLETEPGHGGNYRSLPRAGEVRAVLKEAFEFECYRETSVGPKECDAVTVKLFARKK